MMMNSHSKLPENIYVVYSKDGRMQVNRSTGTRLYTREANAVRNIPFEGYVVEYELESTGRILINKKDYE